MSLEFHSEGRERLSELAGSGMTVSECTREKARKQTNGMFFSKSDQSEAHGDHACMADESDSFVSRLQTDVCVIIASQSAGGK